MKSGRDGITVSPSVLREKASYEFEDLLAIVALLRSEHGCPWDRMQTHASIRKNLIEEAYELAEALDLDDSAMLQEEAGDLLLQIVFHERIEEERGRGSFQDAVEAVCRKLIYRHPHIFREEQNCTAAQVSSNWDELKKQEKKQTSCSDSLRSVAKTLPSLVRCQKLQKKAAQSGLYRSEAPVLTKEELLQQLFSVCAAANSMEIDLEEALYFANEEFIQKMEEKEKVCYEGEGI